MNRLESALKRHYLLGIKVNHGRTQYNMLGESSHLLLAKTRTKVTDVIFL